MKGVKGMNEKQFVFVLAFIPCIPFIPVHILLFDCGHGWWQGQADFAEKVLCSLGFDESRKPELLHTQAVSLQAVNNQQEIR
jgi:hypothetical protein